MFTQRLRFSSFDECIGACEVVASREWTSNLRKALEAASRLVFSLCVAVSPDEPLSLKNRCRSILETSRDNGFEK